MAPAVEDDELLIGLDTMRAWGAVGRDFPKPNSEAFSKSRENMDAIKLRIAVLEKSIQETVEQEEITLQTEECQSTKQSNNTVTETCNENDTAVIFSIQQLSY